MTDERTVLFLYADTGGGHRRVADAVIEALADRYPGAITTVRCDPLTGPSASRSTRWLAGLYGPCIRRAAWAWGAAYYLSGSRPAMAVLRRTLFAPVRRPVAAAAIGAQANVIVSCHPLTGWAAIQAARCDPGGHVPVVSVVTDLAAIHTSWRHPRPDLVTVPSAQALQLFTSGRDGCIYTGLPVDARARSGPLPPEEKAAVRRSLGLRETGCVVLLSGGGEGCGGLARRSAAILRRFPDIQVVAACGRNDRLRRRLTALASRAGDRLTVIGFTANFTDWLHCADLVVTKAGPGMIAEAACCGTPLLLASHLPGQERRNTELVEQAGAGRRVRSVRRLLRELARLRSDPVGLAAMQAGCRRLARPGAADHVARLIGELAGLAPPRTHEVATAAPPEAVGQLTGATASGQVAR